MQPILKTMEYGVYAASAAACTFAGINGLLTGCWLDENCVPRNVAYLTGREDDLATQFPVAAITFVFTARILQAVTQRWKDSVFVKSCVYLTASAAALAAARATNAAHFPYVMYGTFLVGIIVFAAKQFETPPPKQQPAKP